MADGVVTTPRERVAPGVDLIAGDCLDVLPTLAAESIHCVVTSPPYWGLRDYGLSPRAWPAMEYSPVAGCPPVSVPAMTCPLGLEPDPVAFVGHLLTVLREARRVLRRDGTAWVNLGDSYAANRSPGPRHGKHAPRLQKRGGAAVPRGLKPKDLIGIPWRFALAAQADGWWLRSDVVWSKSNAMPSSVDDRPTSSHEDVFLLTRRRRYSSRGSPSVLSRVGLATSSRRAGLTRSARDALTDTRAVILRALGVRPCA